MAKLRMGNLGKEETSDNSIMPDLSQLREQKKREREERRLARMAESMASGDETLLKNVGLKPTVPKTPKRDRKTPEKSQTKEGEEEVAVVKVEETSQKSLENIISKTSKMDDETKELSITKRTPSATKPKGKRKKGAGRKKNPDPYLSVSGAKKISVNQETFDLLESLQENIFPNDGTSALLQKLIGYYVKKALSDSDPLSILSDFVPKMKSYRSQHPVNEVSQVDKYGVETHVSAKEVEREANQRIVELLGMSFDDDYVRQIYKRR